MFEEIPFSREAKLVYAEAADIARRAGKPFDSAHVVLAVFTVPCEAQAVLIEKRTDCDRVLDALPGIDPEPRETVGMLYTTAAQIASNVGSRQVTSVHLLMAVSRMPSSRAARALERAGLPMFVLRTQAMAHLTDPRLRRAATERMAAAGGPLPPVVPVPVPVQVPRGGTPVRPDLPPAPSAPAARPAPGVVPQPAARRASPPPVVEDESAPIVFEFDLSEDEPADEAPAPGVRSPAPAGDTPRPRPAAVRDDGRFDLDPDTYPTLCALGRNLTAEAAQGLLDPLVGRHDALDAVVDILCKRRANNPILLGDPGVGKTALVEGLANLVVSGEGDLPGLSGKVIVSISVADLLAGTAMRGSFAARLKALKDEVLAADRRVILFIDEIHTLIGAGQGDGGMDAANDLKGALARGQFPCIGATTFGEFKRYVLSDDALRRRFEPVYLREPSLEEAERILAGVAPRYAAHHDVAFGEDAIRAAVRLTDRVIPDRSLPAKAIDVLDRVGARVRREGRATATREDVVRVLSALVDLPPEFLVLSPAERLRGMEQSLHARVFGQDAAVSAIVRVVAQNWARYGSRRPLGSFVFAGPAGAGKRTTAMAMAEFLFGSGQAVLEVDLADYAEVHSLSHLIGSPPGYVGHEEGGLLADTLVRRPFLLIVWHHVDQAHPTVQSLIAQTLTEGTATDRRGRRMDFRNTVQVFVLSGADFAGGAARPVGFGTGAAPAATADQATARCRKLLPAELLAGIDQVVPFPSLDDAALGAVAARIVREAADRFRDEQGVVLSVDDAVPAAVARHVHAAGGGGAQIESLVAEALLRPATDAVYADPVLAGRDLVATLDPAAAGRPAVVLSAARGE